MHDPKTCIEKEREPLPVDSPSDGSEIPLTPRKELKAITFDEAEILAKTTDYAQELCDCDGMNPVNWADASAFFLEGYEFARRTQKTLEAMNSQNDMVSRHGK